MKTYIKLKISCLLLIGSCNGDRHHVCTAHQVVAYLLIKIHRKSIKRPYNLTISGVIHESQAAQVGKLKKQNFGVRKMKKVSFIALFMFSKCIVSYKLFLFSQEQSTNALRLNYTNKWNEQNYASLICMRRKVCDYGDDSREPMQSDSPSGAACIYYHIPTITD